MLYREASRWSRYKHIHDKDKEPVLTLWKQARNYFDFCLIPYYSDEDISNIMTPERNIYGGGPGQQQYLAMVECVRPLDVLQPPPGATDVFNDCFWLEIALYPGA